MLGATEDGLGISIRLLAIKSTLDGIAAIGFASVYGWGVLASLLVIAVYQGAVTPPWPSSSSRSSPPMSWPS